MTVDGSVDSIKVARLGVLSNAATATQAEIDSYSPAGQWEVPDSILGDPLATNQARGRIGRDGLENGDGTMLGIPGGFFKFSAYFWATRHGLSGRDIPR